MAVWHLNLTSLSGKGAEDQALLFLKKQGLSLVERNWACRFGEIDLVMREQYTYVFVEVKYRKNNHFGGVLHSISAAKCAKLLHAAEYYLSIKKIRPECRIDAVFLQDDVEPLWLKNITG